jgi:alpha-tubulin suppressor-like RCC1 family protein
MAWCGPEITIVRAGPAADAQASSSSTLMCFGKVTLGHATELPEAVQEQEFLRTPHAIPRPAFDFRKDAVQVAFGDRHWAVVTADGGLFTAGDNSWGQLGRGTHFDHGILPLQNVFAGRVSRVACGRQHTLAVYAPLTLGGQQVWGCGCNTDHQLSVEVFLCEGAFSPLDISTLTPATASRPGSFLRIAAGADFSVVSVDDVVAIIGNGAPRQPGAPRAPRGFKIPADSAAGLPWHGSPIKHLVAGSAHVLIGCACDKRLRVWGWGSNRCRQLGFPGAARVFDKPTEIAYGCPQQASDAFPSMLAASDCSSMIMANGQVWAMGNHEAENFEPTAEEPNFLDSTVMHARAVDPQCFDNRPVAYVGTGPRHAAFVTTCGRLYVRGYCSWRGSVADPVARVNGLPTAFRSTKQGVRGVCGERPLARPRLVPCELFGKQACGLVRQPLAHKLAFLMGTHARLRESQDGVDTAGFAAASLDTLLLKMILDACDALLPALVRA